jgi:hypothetical protein
LPRLRRALVAAFLAACLLPASASALDPILTDQEKQDKMISMLEAWVPLAETTYTSGPPHPYFDVSGSGVFLERGEASIAFTYATLLRAKPAASFIGGLARATMENHVEEAIDDITSAYVSNLGAIGWGGDPGDGSDPRKWQGPTVAAQMGWAAKLAWSTLDATTQAEVEEVVAGEADAVVAYAPENGTSSDSAAEENGMFATAPAIAAVLFPAHRNARIWAEEAIRMALNSPSRNGDSADARVVDGQQLRAWVTTVNLQDDWGMVNHGIFHPVYEQGIASGESEMASWYSEVGRAIPTALSWRMAEIWDQILGWLATDDGDLAAPQSTDWVNHDYQHIESLASMATRLQRHDASIFESRALELLERRQNAHASGAFYSNADVGYESDVAKTLAGAWMIHERFGPSPNSTTPQFDAARAAFHGVKQFADVRLIVNQQPNALVTMSWQNAGTTAEPMGLVIPSDTGHEDDPVLMLYEKNSSLGSLDGDVAVSATNCRCDRDFFSTAGTFSTPAGRKFSMTSFDDGSVLLLDRGVGETFAYSFEDVPGLAPSRVVWDQNGTVNAFGSIAGTWTNVDDRFGLIVKGGAGLFYEQRSDDDNPQWDHITGDRGNGRTQHRGALVLPLATHSQTSSLNADVLQPTVPTDWSALTARALDGTARIAVANWTGSRATGRISNLSSSLGVPIPDRPNDVVVTGSTGSSDFTLEAVSSTGEKGYFWVTSSVGNTVTVKPISERLIRLTNGGASNAVTVKYDAGPLAEATGSVTLPANTVAYAIAYNGDVEIVTPRASSTSGSQTPALAFDGSNSTYWSSTATTLASPECLVLDMGGTVTMGRVTMVPRRGFGPKDYKVQTAAADTTCRDETGWATRATVSASGDGTTRTHSWTPNGDRYVRIRVTAAWGSSPFSVGVMELTPAPS